MRHRFDRLPPAPPVPRVRRPAAAQAARDDHRRPLHAGFLQLGHAGGDVLGTGLYAASPHCRWPRLRRAGRLGRQIGLVAAAAALWLWMAELGFAAGLVAMLCTWMLAAMLLPALAPGTDRARSCPDVGARLRRHHRRLPACSRRYRPAGLASAGPLAASAGTTLIAFIPLWMLAALWAFSFRSARAWLVLGGSAATGFVVLGLLRLTGAVQ